uniref:Uncharacterized protein n=1 Tax=Panagrolaimus davidi TaxID=227884 RepID=A0A914Q054_9BILA
MLTVNDQIFSTVGYLLLLPLLSLIILITCRKLRPSKDIPPKASTTIKDDAKTEPSAKHSSKKVKSSKEKHHKNRESHHSSDRHHKHHKQATMSGLTSKEATEGDRCSPNKKTSNEKIKKSSSDDRKKKHDVKFIPSAENIKVSNFGRFCRRF